MTGEYTLLLKVKANNATSLEELIRQIRSIEGVERTETSVVLSTYTEGLWLALESQDVLEGTRREENGTVSLALKARRSA